MFGLLILVFMWPGISRMSSVVAWKGLVAAKDRRKAHFFNKTGRELM